jgi:hypothetical protein
LARLTSDALNPQRVEDARQGFRHPFGSKRNDASGAFVPDFAEIARCRSCHNLVAIAIFCRVAGAHSVDKLSAWYSDGNDHLFVPPAENRRDAIRTGGVKKGDDRNLPSAATSQNAVPLTGTTPIKTSNPILQDLDRDNAGVTGWRYRMGSG